MEAILTFMKAQPVLVFFLVLSLGYLVGRIGAAGISLGPAGGVLLREYGWLVAYWNGYRGVHSRTDMRNRSSVSSVTNSLPSKNSKACRPLAG